MKSRTFPGTLITAALLLAITLGAARDKQVVIEGTGQIAISQPTVHVQLKRDGKVLTGDPLIPLLSDERETSLLAYLDTGSSATVLSAGAAQRFGVKVHDGALYHEVGLHGETAMRISEPYDLSLIGASGGLLDDAPTDGFLTIQRNCRMQINTAAGLGGLIEMNIVGMHAIRGLFVEIDTSPMHGADGILSGPAVTLSTDGRIPRDADLVIELVYRDFNRRTHPENKPPLPDLAENPVIVGIVAARDGRESTGDWLLDTGAATSIISTQQAQRLGLYDTDGSPRVEPIFTLPLSGVSGQTAIAPGYVIDELRIPTRDRTILIFRNAHVVVLDIAATLDDGSTVILDGIFGVNLLLPSVSMPISLTSEIGAGPFDHIYIDGKRCLLGLDVRD
ncbi:MAG: hypothetical protein KAS72_12475 [Phycisphaerales bacterium]|nr:hypothetical protein [Phycisphaerales bacterium]